MKKTVGIIGGGAAGLCALKHCLETKGLYPILWEQTNKIGGTWVYSSDVGTDNHGLPIHSSMYQSLRTNLPKEVMGFPDFPFPEGGRSFIHHTDVLQYLEKYAANFNITPHIKFEHHVELVEPQNSDESETAWCVTTKNLTDSAITQTICDALIVCNGHYSVPKFPGIMNHDKFKGLKTHSHYYKEPSKYEGLQVVVLGAAASGIDISLEVSKVASQVFLSHNHPIPIPSKLPSNLSQVKGISSATESGFILTDGTRINVDAIIYCTGYEYTFPFLSPSCDVSVVDNRVEPLYKHMINSTYPTMSFIGLPYMCLPFLMFDLQVRFVVATVVERILLPTVADMKKEQEKEIKDFIYVGNEVRHYPHLGERQWQYYDKISSITNTTFISRDVRNLMKIIIQRIVMDLTQFKKYEYAFESGRIIERNSSTKEIINTNRELWKLRIYSVVKVISTSFSQLIRLLCHLIYKRARLVFLKR